MFQNIAEILKSFTGKQRLTVLIFLLITIMFSIFIKSYFSTADLAPVQKQLNQCIVSQGDLVNQNSNLINKSKENVALLMHMDSMLTNIKPDTVYIKDELVSVEPHVAQRHTPPGVDGVMTAAPLERAIPQQVKRTFNVKSGNSAKVVGDVRKLILERAKN